MDGSIGRRSAEELGKSIKNSADILSERAERSVLCAGNAITTSTSKMSNTIEHSATLISDSVVVGAVHVGRYFLYHTVESILAKPLVKFLIGSIGCYFATKTFILLRPIIDYIWLKSEWINTGSMNEARHLHTVSIFTDGKVLVTGGDGNRGMLDSAELYDPSTDSWTTTGNLNHARYHHKASVLIDGKVLVTRGSNGSSLNSAELYDPSTGSWITTGNLNNARHSHTASVLNNGKVLVTGGLYSEFSTNSAELY